LLNTDQNNLGKTRVINILGSLLDKGDEVDRCYACRTLGMLGDNRVTDKLAERLRDEDIDVCIDAAEALGRLGVPDSISTLVESMYKDPDGEVKVAVVEALGQIGYQTGNRDVIEPLLDIAANRPEDMISDESETWDSWWDMQLKAVEALGRMQTKEAVPVLQAILNDEEGQDIESEILKVLAIIGIEGEEVLRQRLVDGTPRQRRRAARALGHTNSEVAITALTAALQDQDSDVRIASVEALHDCNAVEPLAAILLSQQDYDADVCSAAITAIQQLGSFDRLPVEQMTKFLVDDNAVLRKSALAALSTRTESLNDETLNRVMSAVEDPNPGVVIAACKVLAGIQTESIQQLLLNVLADKERQVEVRTQVAHCLGKSGMWNADSAACMEKTVIDDVAEVRLATLNALLELANGMTSKIQDNAEDKEIKSPLQIILSALNGDIKPPASTKVIPIIPVEDNEQDASAVTAEDPLKLENNNDDNNQEGAKSTIEAITLANVEATLTASEPAITEKQGDEDIQKYKEIIDQHNETAEWLFAKENRAAAADARCLAATVLGKYSVHDPDDVITTLIAALDDDDSKLVREALESIALLLSHNPDFELTNELYTALIQQLESEDRNIRIAGARAIGYSGKTAAIDPLFKCTETDDVSMRINAMYSLIELFLKLSRANQSDYADKAIKLIKLFMVNLDDKESGVRMASITGLPKLLNSLEPNDKKEKLLNETIEKIIHAGIYKDGTQAGSIGKVLQQIAPDQSAMKLLKQLETQTRSIERRFVIEMLEEIYT
jgi:HEAT repeat protein